MTELVKLGTLKDVARAAGVSISTASRALSGSNLIGVKTKSRVQAAAEQLNYRPNSFARGLKTHSSKLVGVLVHNLVATSYRTIAENAQQRLSAAGYQVILGISGDDPLQEARFLGALEDYRVEGLIIVPTNANGPILKRLRDSGVNIITVIRQQTDLQLDAVMQGDADGAYRGTNYLLDIGHKDIGIITGRTDTTSGGERLSGYRRAHMERGLTPHPDLIFSGPFIPETGFSGCAKILSLERKPTALFVANHEAAMGVLKYVSENDIQIPEELSLLCYEDVPWFSWRKPAISVIDNSAENLADFAVDGLLRQLSDGNPQSASRGEVRVGARLIIRDTTPPLVSMSFGS